MPKKISLHLEANTAVPFRYHPVVGERIKLGCCDILATVVRFCLVVFNDKLDSIILVIWEYSTDT